MPCVKLLQWLLWCNTVLIHRSVPNAMLPLRKMAVVITWSVVTRIVKLNSVGSVLDPGNHMDLLGKSSLVGTAGTKLQKTSFLAESGMLNNVLFLYEKTAQFQTNNLENHISLMPTLSWSQISRYLPQLLSI